MAVGLSRFMPAIKENLNNDFDNVVKELKSNVLFDILFKLSENQEDPNSVMKILKNDLNKKQKNISMYFPGKYELHVLNKIYPKLNIILIGRRPNDASKDKDISHQMKCLKGTNTIYSIIFFLYDNETKITNFYLVGKNNSQIIFNIDEIGGVAFQERIERVCSPQYV